MPANSTDGLKRRNATNACAACKRAKLRCKLPDPNSTERACDRCKTRNTPCVFSAEPDLRAARSSLKAHVESLQARVDQLEAQLAAAGLSPAIATPSSAALQAELPSPPSPQDSIIPLEDDEEEMEMMEGQEQSVRRDREKQPSQDEQVPRSTPSLSRTLKGSLASKQHESFLPFPLSSDLHISLLELAFKHFLNTELLVQREHFFADLNKNRSSLFYSPFLHLAILAIGCRYVPNPAPNLFSNPSDPSDPSSPGEPFVTAALDMLNAELADPQYSTIQGLMVLSRWMGGAKQLQRGSIYTGIATRLCIEFGLHLDTRSAADEAQEPSVRELRQKLFWSCAANESFWSALLGRPSDPFIALSRQPDLPLDGTAWPYLCKLHRIAFKVYELSFGEPDSSRAGGGIREDERGRVAKVKQVGEELKNWYGTIPAALRWETSSTGDPDMLTLNLIYRQTLLFLYRPFLLDAPAPFSNSLAAPTTSDSLIALLPHARKVLTGLCVEIARIGEKYHVEMRSRQVPDSLLPAFFHAGAVSLQLSLLPPLPDSPTLNNLPVQEVLLDAYSRCIHILDEMGHSCSAASAAAATLRELRENPATAETAETAPSVTALSSGGFHVPAHAVVTETAAAAGAGAVSAGQPVAPFPTASTSTPSLQQPSSSSAAHFVASLDLNPFHNDPRSRQFLPPSSSSATVATAFFPSSLASTSSSPFPPFQQQQCPDGLSVPFAGGAAPPSRDGSGSTGIDSSLVAKPTRPA